MWRQVQHVWSAGKSRWLALSCVCLLSACTAGERPDIYRLAAAPEPSEPPVLGADPYGEAEVGVEGQGGSTRLGMVVERRNRVPGATWDGHPDERWRNAVTADADARPGDGTRLGLSANFVESLRTTGESSARALLVGPQTDWRRNTAANLSVSFDLGQDWITFSSSQALSDYATSYRDDRRARGFSLAQRLDANLIRSEQVRLSAFASHSVMDDDFASMGLRGRTRAFERRGYRTYGLGASLGSGPVELTVSRTARERVGDRSRGEEEAGYEALLSTSLDGLWSRMAEAVGGGWAWSLAPGSVWFSWAPGWVDPGDRGTGRRDSVDEYGIGSSWHWDGAYVDVGFWRYDYDGRQLGAEDADWLGHGIHSNAGLYGDLWSIDAGLAFSRGRNEEFLSRSRDRSYDGYLSLSYKPPGFPDLTLGFVAGRYGIDYLVHEAAGLTNYWEFNAELDFSKFFRGDGAPQGPNLSVLYEMRSLQGADDFHGPYGEAEHIVGIIYRLEF